MTFISYAQNFEDVMLWRALKHVSNGFYIDVGANDPTVDSVTRSFYERGWRGINIEPMRQYYDRLCSERPLDINLPIAIGEKEGVLNFFDIPDTGLSTIDVAIAEKHISEGKRVITELVQVMPLAMVCQEHALESVHFLKIDVEGFEATVLRGMDFKKCRPWILVIEATKPQTQITSHDEWEHIVLNAGYRSAYFDGLNHFYVAEEHLELLEEFKSPPNFFDNFRLCSGHYYSYPLTEFEARIHQAEARAWQAEVCAKNEAVAAQQMAIHAQHVTERMNQLDAQLAGLFLSASWRLTRPLRAAKQMMRSPSRIVGELGSRFSAFTSLVTKFIGRGVRWMVTRQRLRGFIARKLARFPFLDTKVRRLASFLLRTSAANRNGGVPGKVQENPAGLPESAQKVLSDIQRAVGKSSSR